LGTIAHAWKELQRFGAESNANTRRFRPWGTACSRLGSSPVRRRLAALTLCLLALSACGREDEGTPAGCLAGGEEVLAALEAAPGQVKVDGTPISDCVGDTTDGGALQAVGTAYLAAASSLADRASGDPEGEAALQLGYLLGAVKRSEAGAQGVGYELARRLQAEAARVADGSEALARGRRAGREGG
jgi:hypothetical protein